MRCLNCENGVYETLFLDYKTEGRPGELLIIPEVPHEVCTLCEDVCFSKEASLKIEEARTKAGAVYRLRLKKDR